MTAPAVGQVWEDADPRERGRTLRIDEVHKDYVIASVVTLRDGKPTPHPRQTKISNHRLKPSSSGYRLVEP